MLPVIVCAPDPGHLDTLLDLLGQASAKSQVHTQVIIATTSAKEAQAALKKTQGIILMLTWLPPLTSDEVPACVELGQQVMDMNHDSYTLYVVDQSKDLIQSARLCRRSYALLMAEDLQITAVPVLTQMLQEFRSTTDPESAVADDFIMLRVNGTYMRIMKKDIRYIESLEKKLVFNLGVQSLALYSSIATYEELLQEQFVRCHRSFLVNISHIQAVNLPALTLTLSDGSVLPISRSQRSRMKTLLGTMQDIVSQA